MLDSFLNLNANLQIDSPWLFLILLWVLPWKGVALWKAARNSDKKWFVALFLLNTLAILEIIYIFVFSKTKQKTDVEPD
jgi:4-amino-4-deoxy-L-arabinose transferase-like glycosyltransferase